VVKITPAHDFNDFESAAARSAEHQVIDETAA
jgi:valyl-tRNA synthetase